MMSAWDQRYTPEEYVYGLAPNDFLASQTDLLRPGLRALVPGDGEGRNGVWLAEQGLQVVTVDASVQGIRKAQALAAARAVKIETVQADLAQWAWPVAAFDVVVSIYLHVDPGWRARLHANLLAALRPSGVIILEAFTPQQLTYQARYNSGGPRQREWLFTRVMLNQDFAAAEPRLLEEQVVTLREGRLHNGPAAVIRGVWQAPA